MGAGSNTMPLVSWLIRARTVWMPRRILWGTVCKTSAACAAASDAWAQEVDPECDEQSG